MNTMKVLGLTVLLVACLLLAVGCSDKKGTNPPTSSQPLQIMAIDSLISRVVPPEYTAPAGSPTTIDSVWLYGSNPLLSNVFGSDNPQTLYSNISKFKLNVDICSNFLRADANGAVVTGVVNDSMHVETTPGDSIWFHCTGTISHLNSAIAIPEAAQGIIGSSVELDYLISIQVSEVPTMRFYIALRLTDTTQTFLQFFKDTGAKGETQMVYLNLRKADSTFDFRGLGHCVQEPYGESLDSSRFSWGYNITSSANANFAYRMAYTSNGWDNTNVMYKFLGGGNKDTEFALKYRTYVPAEATVCDSLHMYEAVFGPNYAEGTSLITAFDSYLDEDLLYPYSAIPQLPLANPFE
jgi:hypothetical protein